jgi:IclR family pca regulon transcriptional regulator
MNELSPRGRRAGPQAAAGTDLSPADALGRWTGDPRFMQSLARGLLTLGVVTAGEGEPVSARQIAAATGLSLASVHRCLYTLHATGHVRANRNGAVPGPALAALTSDYAAASPLTSRCGPVLDRLRQDLGVSISLATFETGQATIVASSTSESLLKIDLPVGAVVPIHCSSAGKVYLAALSEEALARRMRTIDFKAYTERTITTPEALAEELRTVRRRGYAVVEQELALGLRSASVPIIDAHGTLAGSLNASAIVGAVGLRDLKSKIVPALMRASEDLARNEEMNGRAARQFSTRLRVGSEGRP